jgi:hypothetical protein|tara:strand:- start:712 stop:1116 length:405 start_codon:yes stop_codon:yes gene_type:complete
MPLESAADFNSYVDINTGHGVTATFFEVQQSLWDSRVGLIDTWFDIDSGNTTNINIIIDQEYFNIEGGTVPVAGYQPRAIVKSTDVPYISHEDKLVVNAITTDQGNVLKAETTFLVKTVEPDNTGLISLVLEEQ